MNFEEQGACEGILGLSELSIAIGTSCDASFHAEIPLSAVVYFFIQKWK